MNKTHIAILSATGLSLAAFALGPASAEAPKNVANLEGKTCPALGKCMKGPVKMNFSDAQLEKLNSLKLQAQEFREPLVLKLKNKRQELMDSLTKQELNKDEILKLQSQINELKSELANNRISYMIEASNVLTPEQKQIMHRSMLMKNIMGKKHLMKMKAGVKTECGVTNKAVTSSDINKSG